MQHTIFLSQDVHFPQILVSKLFVMKSPFTEYISPEKKLYNEELNMHSEIMLESPFTDNVQEINNDFLIDEPENYIEEFDFGLCYKA